MRLQNSSCGDAIFAAAAAARWACLRRCTCSASEQLEKRRARRGPKALDWLSPPWPGSELNLAQFPRWEPDSSTPFTNNSSALNTGFARARVDSRYLQGECMARRLIWIDEKEIKG